MPEETLKYRVEIDSSDVGAQLDQIREQIDTAVGANAAASVAPAGMSQFFNSGFTPALNGSFASPDLTNNMNTGLARVMDMIDRSTDRAQLGYSHFVDDARRIGLMSSSNFPSYSPPLSAAQSQLNQGFFGSAVGMFGMGYEPRGSLSVGEFRTMSSESFAESTGSFAASFPGLSAGIAAAALTPVGWPAVAAGLVFDMSVGTLTGPARERDRFATSLRNFTDPILGGMSRESSRDITDVLYSRAHSYEGYLEDINMKDIQEIMATFGKAGGYSGVHNPQEFQQRTTEVLDNIRMVAHSLNVFQEEAAQIMGELQQRGIHGMQGMGGFAAGQQAAGALVGMTGLDFIQGGLYGAQMVQGSRIGATTGFNLMQESLLSVGNIQENPFGAFLIQDMGGPQAAAAAAMETVLRHRQGGLGFIQGANVLGGGNYFDGNVTNQLIGASEFLSADPLNYFKLLGAQGQLTGSLGNMYGIQGMQIQMVKTATEQMKAMGYVDEGGKIGSLELTGFMMQVYGMSANDAEMLVYGAMNGGSFSDRDKVDKSVVDQIMQENSYGIFSRGSARVKEWGASIKEAFTEDAGKGWTIMKDFVTDKVNSGLNNLRGRQEVTFGGISDPAIIALLKSPGMDLIASKDNNGINEVANIGKKIIEERPWLRDMVGLEEELAEMYAGVSDSVGDRRSRGVFHERDRLGLTNEEVKLQLRAQGIALTAIEKKEADEIYADEIISLDRNWPGIGTETNTKKLLDAAANQVFQEPFEKLTKVRQATLWREFERQQPKKVMNISYETAAVIGQPVLKDYEGTSDWNEKRKELVDAYMHQSDFEGKSLLSRFSELHDIGWFLKKLEKSRDGLETSLELYIKHGEGKERDMAIWLDNNLKATYTPSFDQEKANKANIQQAKAFIGEISELRQLGGGAKLSEERVKEVQERIDKEVLKGGTETSQRLTAGNLKEAAIAFDEAHNYVTGGVFSKGASKEEYDRIYEEYSGLLNTVQMTTLYNTDGIDKEFQKRIGEDLNKTSRDFIRSIATRMETLASTITDGKINVHNS